MLKNKLIGLAKLAVTSILPDKLKEEEKIGLSGWVLFAIQVLVVVLALGAVGITLIDLLIGAFK